MRGLAAGNMIESFLLWQSLVAVNSKLRFCQWRTCSRLSPSHAEVIETVGNNSISLFIHFAQVARIQREEDMLGFASNQTQPREPA